ncbi:MAG: alpha/beta hydrolase [Alteraurantiacibacter sp.]
MRRLAILATLIASQLALPAAAQTYTYEEVTETWVDSGAQRFVSPQLAQAERAAIAAYGPFRVIDGSHAALVGITDSYSPAEFAQMLADFPAIATLLFIDCPGTYDDRANLRLGRMIRDHGLAVEVPEGGSVRSGAVELVLAGSSLTIADGAEFAVHSWLDDRGLGAWDYAPDSPEHAKYLDYYREMGMSREAAASFYAMTNSVPFESALWLDGREMRGWMQPDLSPAPLPQAPRMAYLALPDLDLMTALN